MTRNRRPSPQTMRVLQALAANPSDWRYGYELGLEIGLKAGSFYPILIRLADRGLLEQMWETAPPEGRPPRHLYRLTASGLTLAQSAAQGSAAPSTSDTGTAEPARRRLRSAW